MLCCVVLSRFVICGVEVVVCFDRSVAVLYRIVSDCIGLSCVVLYVSVCMILSYVVLCCGVLYVVVLY